MAKMRKAVDKREDDIKKKLTAAIMMLLVSCIMVVTSTYAWFTLSTAPEVTGIQTTIGGNGNLEIALANKETWAGAEPATLTGYTDTTPVTTINESWGNLITLDNTNYGINLLNLSPAALALTQGTNIISNEVLELPKYGADGRISSLEDAISGIYSNGAFGSNDGRGLRAFGLSVKMTERQSAYNKYLNLSNSATTSAVTALSTSLSANGGVLANTAVNLALSDAGDNMEFNAEQTTSIRSLVTATASTLTYVDQAIIASINAYLASSLSGMTDTVYNSIKTTIEGLTVLDNITVAGDTVTVKSSENTTLKELNHPQLASLITKYNDAYTKVNTAKTQMDAITTETTTWGTVKGIVGSLMNINAIMSDKDSKLVTINGMSVNELKTHVGYENGNKDNLNVDNAIALLQGMVIELNKGSGLFYDLAELSGNLESNFSSKVSLLGMGATINAAIEANPVDPTPLLPAIYSGISNKAPSSESSSESNVISDVYGYAVDLLFRTNADSSSLLLQTLAKDRIYTDNNNPQTQGAGSYFEFRRQSTTFSDEQMLNLMKSIKIVITDETNKILAEARLDTRKGQYVANGETIYIPIRLVDTTKQLGQEGYFIEDGSTVDTSTNKPVANQQAITSLTKNEKTQISFLVYLDGTTVTNADVANAAKSMTGTMNLQFASSAGLEAMDYSGLKVDGTESNTGTTTPENGSGEQTGN